jgi:hypothetical protein
MIVWSCRIKFVGLVGNEMTYLVLWGKGGERNSNCSRASPSSNPGLAAIRRILTEYFLIAFNTIKEHAVAQLVEALSYKQESRGFDSRRCHWNFSLT